jgi:hypothetical protein
MSASIQQGSAFCRLYLSRLNARTMRLRVSLHLNSSIFTSQRPFIVRCSRSPDARLRGGSPLGVRRSARDRASSRPACLEGARSLGFGAANQPLRLHWRKHRERLQEAVHRLHKTRDSSCNAVTTTPTLPIHCTQDSHTTMPSAANCKCSIATRVIAFS